MRIFDCLLLRKVTTGIYSSVPLIVKIISLAEASSLILFLLSAADKTQCFVHLSFDFTLQLINWISSGTAVVAFLKIPFVALGASWAPVFSNNLA